MDIIEKLTIRLANLESQLDQILVENVEFRETIKNLEHVIFQIKNARPTNLNPPPFIADPWRDVQKGLQPRRSLTGDGSFRYDSFSG